MKQEKQNPFIKYNGIKDAKVHIHKTSGLYDASNEHDACGVGMIVDIHGNKSHELVDSALKVLENMKHRGAEGADNKTGDGAGIMLQIPHEFILLQGIPVPEKGKYGTGLVFLPKDEQEQSHMLSVMIEEIEREGLNLMHLRNVPVNSSILGKDASATEPSIKQIFITGSTDTENLERTLYIIRKRIENRIHHKDFYIVSLSSKNIVYKGMLSSVQVREYFPDLTQPYFTSGLAVVHSRFSTNTFPTWSLAQPFRLLAHNGEINTIRGNRAWMEARESVLSTPTLGNVKQIRPIIQPGMSDSASLDNVLEFFVMSGLSLPHAMAMLVPESFNNKNPISEDLKAFYEYHSILMEPWDGPAALLFSDGRYAGGMLDRNGLRPARYLITRNDMMVVASEAGTIHFEPGDIKEKGRLQPGKILLVDTQEGKIYYDGELKAQLAAAKPYRQWLSTNRIELDTLRSGADRFHGERHPVGRIVRQAPTVVQLFPPTVRPSDQPSHRPDTRGIGHVAERVHRCRGHEHPAAERGALQDGATAAPRIDQHPVGHPVQHTLQGLPHREAPHPVRRARREGGLARSLVRLVQASGSVRRRGRELHHPVRPRGGCRARSHSLTVGRKCRTPPFDFRTETCTDRPDYRKRGNP